MTLLDRDTIKRCRLYELRETRTSPPSVDTAPTLHYCSQTQIWPVKYTTTLISITLTTREGSTSTYRSAVHMPVLQYHRLVLTLHLSSTHTTYERRIHMMTPRNLQRKLCEWSHTSILHLHIGIFWTAGLERQLRV